MTFSFTKGAEEYEIEAPDEASALKAWQSSPEGSRTQDPQPQTAQAIQASAPQSTPQIPEERRMSDTAGGDVLGRESSGAKTMENVAWKALSALTPVGSAHGLMTEGMKLDLPTALRMMDVGTSAIPFVQGTKTAFKGALGAGLGAAATGQALDSSGVENAAIRIPAMLAAGAYGGKAAAQGSMKPQMRIEAPMEAPRVQAMPSVGVDVPAGPLAPPAAIAKEGRWGKLSLDAEQGAKIKAIEERIGSKLTKGQIQEALYPGAKTPLKDIEFREFQGPEAIQARGAQSAEWQSRFNKNLESIAPGSTKADMTSAGSSIQNKLAERMATSETDYDEAFKAIQVQGKGLFTNLGKNTKAAIANVVKTEGLTAPEMRTAYKGVLGEANALMADAGTIKNLASAVNFRKGINKWAAGAKDRLGEGQGDMIDRLAGKIASSVDDAIVSTAGKNKELAPLVGQFKDASRGYWAAHFSPEAKDLLRQTGWKPYGFEKQPEAVAKGMMSQTKDMAALMGRASERGLTGKNDAATAVIAQLQEAGQKNPQGIANLWNKLPKSQKSQLFGVDGSAQIDQAVKDLGLLNYAAPGTYMPRTGEALTRYMPGLMEKFAGAVPGGSAVAGGAKAIYESAAPKLYYGGGDKYKVPSSPRPSPMLSKSEIALAGGASSRQEAKRTVTQMRKDLLSGATMAR